MESRVCSVFSKWNAFFSPSARGHWDCHGRPEGTHYTNFWRDGSRLLAPDRVSIWLCEKKWNCVSWYHWDRRGYKFVNRTLLGFVYGALLIFFSPARQGSFSWLNRHIWLQLWSFWAGTLTQPPLQPWDQVCVMAFKDYWNSFLGAQLSSLSITSVLSVMTPSCWSFHSRWNGKKE